MIKKYPYNLISFGVYFYPTKKNLAGIMFKKFSARIKEVIVKQYNGRIDFPELSDEYSYTWYNLVIDTKGITNDNITNEILKTINDQKYNIAEIIGNNKHDTLQMIEHDGKHSKEYRFSYAELLSILASEISMIKLDVSHFLKQRRAYPGSAFLRLYLENALLSIIRRLSNKAHTHNISSNKFIRSAASVEKLYMHIFNTLRQFKTNAMLLNTQSVIYQKLNRDFSKLYDLVILIYDPDIDYNVINEIKSLVNENKYDEALTTIAREYKKCVTLLAKNNSENRKIYSNCHKFTKYMLTVYYTYKIYYKETKSDIIEIYLNDNAYKILNQTFSSRKSNNTKHNDETITRLDNRLDKVVENIVKDVLTNRDLSKNKSGEIFIYKLTI